MKHISLLLVTFLLFIQLHDNNAHAGTGHFHAESESTKAVMSKIWWNQKKKISEFSLTEEQRHKMDHDFIEYMAFHKEDNDNQKKAFEDLGLLLSSGDLKTAAKTRDQVSLMSTVNINRQIDMMVKVVGHLTLEQRELILKKYPKLMSRLWVRSANPAAIQLGRSEAKRGKKNKN